MTTQLIVRVDKEKKALFDRKARISGKSSSEVIRELMDTYVQRQDMRGYLGKLLAEMGTQMKKDGFTVDDVPRIIKEVREEKHKRRQ